LYSLAWAKIILLEWEWVSLKWKFSCLSEIEPESTQNFILGLVWARFLLVWAKMDSRAPHFSFYSRFSNNYLARVRIISPERDMQKNMHKPVKPTFHSTHNFINLHITLTVFVQNYSSTLIESLSYYVNLYICMISKPKSSKIKQPILIKHYIWIDSTNY